MGRDFVSELWAAVGGEGREDRAESGLQVPGLVGVAWHLVCGIRAVAVWRERGDAVDWQA